ncbi:MAG TPA: RNA-binding protein [Candidatus Altiarchaeales archaeon]|nr:RNA-binding protein [Candidatus Altiarchaeales archaeon]
MKNNKALMGDYLGTIEEFVPGEGTYAEDGKVYASNIGRTVIDRENHIVRIDCNIPAELKVGDIIFGEVIALHKNAVTVIAKKISGVKGDIDIKTGLYVSNISDGYVSKPEDMFGIGDIVKAKVIKITPGIVDITTKGNLGVVKAFCKRCRFPLIKSGHRDSLSCTCCGHKEKKKTAMDYGNVSRL